ncbi:phage baseplate assembly protein V [Pectobacterium brasiliense]|uniref:phage baseplate assembly protein V n=1 Tax=Pectobacterium brasiliense TaxID=180957 RepID=UPI001F0886E1|nr:phage baseplate assembly protein V [Pectobacterium brasiliense]
MKTQATLTEILRLLRNIIRVGIVTHVNTDDALCRVQTGEMTTGWLNWLTRRAGRSRDWWAPSIGEQVLILSIGGELDTAVVLPGIYSDANPAPSASADAYHVSSPDGAIIEYEPDTGALTASGIKTTDITASESLTATVPLVTVNASTRITLTVINLTSTFDGKLAVDITDVLADSNAVSEQ